MKVDFRFYSYRPRLRVGFYWEIDTIPSVGDTIRVPDRYIREWDTKYFSYRPSNMDFKVKKRTFLVDPNSRWHKRDVEINL